MHPEPHRCGWDYAHNAANSASATSARWTVHASAKFMAQLMDDYFKSAPFDDQNRNLFAFAAYDAGPVKTKSLRREAQVEKLDPYLWFNNVERVAAARAEQEPVQYMRNIYKNYVPISRLKRQTLPKGPRLPRRRRSPRNHTEFVLVDWHPQLRVLSSWRAGLLVTQHLPQLR